MRPACRTRCRPPLMWLMLLATSLPFCIASAQETQPSITIFVGEDEVACEQTPLSEGDEVLLPSSVLVHQLGMHVRECETIPGMWDVQFYGNRLSVRPGTTAAQINGEATELNAKPKLVDGTLFLPVSALFDCFGIAYDTSRTEDDISLRVSPTGARISAIRHHVHADKLRVAVDLDAPAAFSWAQEGDRVELRVRAPENGPAPLLHRQTVADDLVRSVEAEPQDGAGLVCIVSRGTPECDVFTLGGPPRIVIDFLRPAPPPTSVPSRLHRATQFQSRTFTTSRGPAITNVVVVDLATPGIAVRPALAGETIANRARTSSIGARQGAVAGVNGGFFAPRGQPLGLLVIDGEWITQPIKGRTCLGITTDGKVLMDRLVFDGSVSATGMKTIALDALNCGHTRPNEAISYTRRWGPKLAGHPNAIRIVVTAQGLITLIEKWQRDLTIPVGGFVVSAVGAKAKLLEKAQRGGTATVELKARPNWPNLRHAIGGGPRLVKDGRAHVTAGPEQFRADVALGATPRTAVGVRADGKLLLLTVDGRQPGVSEGVTLRELASLMITLGARDAMALDGGGSTTFWLRGRLVNQPSDGAERKVSNALLVVHEAAGS